MSCLTSHSIVIADDDTDLVNVLRNRCESRGMKVHAAYDAFSAMNLIYEKRPDVVCLDVNMPCGNGLSVLEMLAHDDDLAATPVIVITGDANQETMRRCYEWCAYYVEKSSEIWPRIEPLLEQFLGDDVSACNQQLYQARRQNH